MRRKYKRVEGNQFVVEKKRLKVAGISSSSTRPAHRLRLRCCNLTFLSPYKLMAQLKETYTSLTMAVPSFRNARRAGVGGASTSGTMHLGYEAPNSPSSKVFVSSTKDVVDEAWFQYALNRSIREGKLTFWLLQVFPRLDVLMTYKFMSSQLFTPPWVVFMDKDSDQIVNPELCYIMSTKWKASCCKFVCLRCVVVDNIDHKKWVEIFTESRFEEIQWKFKSFGSQRRGERNIFINFLQKCTTLSLDAPGGLICNRGFVNDACTISIHTQSTHPQSINELCDHK